MRALVLLLVVALLASGCALTRRARNTEATGFLSNADQLQAGGEDEALLVYLNPNAHFARYDKILMDPITTWGSATTTEVDTERLQLLVDYLDATLRTELSKDYEFVDRLGPRVMRLRIAITEAEDSNVTMDVVSNVIPQVRLVTSLAGLATDTELFVGTAGIEGELLGGLTGRRLMAVIDRRGGGRTFEGLTSDWDDVQQAFDFWAKRLRLRLAEASGREPPDDDGDSADSE